MKSLSHVVQDSQRLEFSIVQGLVSQVVSELELSADEIRLILEEPERFTRNLRHTLRGWIGRNVAYPLRVAGENRMYALISPHKEMSSRDFLGVIEHYGWLQTDGPELAAFAEVYPSPMLTKSVLTSGMFVGHPDGRLVRFWITWLNPNESRRRLEPRLIKRVHPRYSYLIRMP